MFNRLVAFIQLNGIMRWLAEPFKKKDKPFSTESFLKDIFYRNFIQANRLSIEVSMETSSGSSLNIFIRTSPRLILFIDINEDISKNVIQRLTYVCRMASTRQSLAAPSKSPGISRGGSRSCEPMNERRAKRQHLKWTRKTHLNLKGESMVAGSSWRGRPVTSARRIFTQMRRSFAATAAVLLNPFYDLCSCH